MKSVATVINQAIFCQNFSPFSLRVLKSYSEQVGNKNLIEEMQQSRVWLVATGETLIVWPVFRSLKISQSYCMVPCLNIKVSFDDPEDRAAFLASQTSLFADVLGFRNSSHIILCLNTTFQFTGANEKTVRKVETLSEFISLDMHVSTVQVVFTVGLLDQQNRGYQAHSCIIEVKDIDNTVPKEVIAERVLNLCRQETVENHLGDLITSSLNEFIV